MIKTLFFMQYAGSLPSLISVFIVASGACTYSHAPLERPEAQKRRSPTPCPCAPTRCPEAEAAEYLRTGNNYLRTASYRKLFAMQVEGARVAYAGDLIAHYMDGYPVWIFLEASEFGIFADFYLFCSKRWGDEAMLYEHYILKSVKAMRNACARNSCIVNGFSRSAESAGYTMPQPFIDALNEAGVKDGKGRRAKMRNLRIA